MYNLLKRSSRITASPLLYTIVHTSFSFAEAVKNKYFFKTVKVLLAIFAEVYYNMQATYAGVMELVDVVDSKSTGGDTVPVRARPPAPKKARPHWGLAFLGTIIVQLIFGHLCELGP